MKYKFVTFMSFLCICASFVGCSKIGTDTDMDNSENVTESTEISETVRGTVSDIEKSLDSVSLSYAKLEYNSNELHKPADEKKSKGFTSRTYAFEDDLGALTVVLDTTRDNKFIDDFPEWSTLSNKDTNNSLFLVSPYKGSLNICKAFRTSSNNLIPIKLNYIKDDIFDEGRNEKYNYFGVNSNGLVIYYINMNDTNLTLMLVNPDSPSDVKECFESMDFIYTAGSNSSEKS